MAGVDAPKNLIAGDPYNETGYWEPVGLNNLDEEVLAALGVTWHSPSTLPGSVLRSAKAKRFIAKYADVLDEEYGDSALFCVKDPRLCRLLPILAQALEKLKIEPSYVIQSRNPLEVAESLKRRDGFASGESLMLWLRHMVEAEAHTRGKPRVFVTYDQLLEDWRSVLSRIGERLEVSWPRRASAIGVEFERILSRGLRHHTATTEQLAKRADVPDWIAKARAAILEASVDAADPAGAFDAIRRDLENADKAFEPILFIEQQRQRNAEHSVAGAKMELQTAREEIASVQAHVTHLEEHITTLHERFDATEMELESARSLVAEREVELESTESALHLARGRAAEIDSEYTDVKARLQTVTNETSEARRQIAELEQHVVTLERQGALLEMELAEARNEAESAAADVSKSNDTLEQARIRAGETASELESTRGHVKHLEQYISNLQEKCDASETHLKAAQTQVVDREVELAIARQELPRLKASVSEAQARVKDLEHQVDERRRELTERGRDVLKREQEEANLKGRLTDLERKNAERDRVIAEREREVPALGSRITQLEHQLTEREQQRDDYRSRLADREADFKRRLAERESEIARLREQLDALASSEAEARTYRTGAERQLAKRSDEVVKARLAFSTAEADVAVITAKLAQLNVQLELDRETLVERQNDLDKSKEEVKRLHDVVKTRDDRLEQLCGELVAARSALDAAQMELRSEREAFIRAQRLAASNVPEPVERELPQNVQPVLARSSTNRIGVERPAEMLERYRRIASNVEKRGRERRSYFEHRDVTPIRVDDHEKALALLSFDEVAQPVVDVLIPCFNEFETTVECLAAIKAANPSVPYRVILSDDGSADERMRSFSSVSGLIFLTSAVNRNFLLNCNEAFASVKAPYLLLLNNDAQVESGCIERLIEAIENERGAVAAGPKILYPNGRLQEAGCSIRADASTIMVGVGENPDEPQYNYRREIEYASGACLMIRTAAIGGTLFDSRYAPAYCEDVDLCLRLRDEGGRIMYEPSARAIHHLSVSTGRMGQTRRVQLAVRNQEKVFQKWGDRLALENRARVLAFYLPQFHPIAENDLWWGRGFTEWTNVTDAVPSFEGHYQPHLPADLGFYDLRLTDVMGEQQALAERYGIEGFVVYYYNFAGRRVLEAPMENLLRRPDVNFRFALCWANENWTKHWDGGTREVLLAQSYDQQALVTVADDAIRFARDPRSIRVDGKPLFLIYRPLLIPEMPRFAEYLRKRFSQAGFPGLHLVYVESMESFHNRVAPSDVGFDACVEFPPHGIAAPWSSPLPNLRDDWNGYAYDYVATVENALSREGVAYSRYPCVFPSWDNTPRQSLGATIMHDATPEVFQAYVEGKLDDLDRFFVGDKRLLFVNAWNEWAEGTHLEPDHVYGHRWLEAVRRALIARGALGSPLTETVGV